MALPNSFAESEQELLKFWAENKIFERSIKQRDSAPCFSFYDGPPFANGLPHYGHMLASVIKDSVTRYWTMRGFKVERTFGWDCHGLPVENEVEKELKLKSKSQIEKLKDTPQLSIAEFNRLCRISVFRYQKEWRSFLERIGRWADHSNEYATLNNEYISSVWWAFSELYKKGLVYQDYRVSPYCPRCGTPLSNFEVNQGYKTVKDPAVFIKLKLKAKLDSKVWGEISELVYMVAWTTTPWTLPGNVALAVHPDIDYVGVKDSNGNVLIVAESRLPALRAHDSTLGEVVTKPVNGEALVGYEYEPLFDIKPLQSAKSYKIYPAEFVTTEDGTGVVHTAVMYGEDDFVLGKKVGLPQYHTVDTEGHLTKDVAQFAGMFVKDADPLIIEDLKTRGLLVGETELAEHEYPFCYRCDSPLLYYALTSWFVKVTSIKDELIEANNSLSLTDAGGLRHDGIRWLPAHLKEGRFGNWLEGARDWAVSRNRYWGAPLPIWQCEKCHKLKVVGQQNEIAPFAGQRNTFFVLRHGQAENNVKEILASEHEGEKYGLTELGRQKAKEAALKLQTELKTLNKDKSEVIILTSPIRRAHETAEIVSKELGLTASQLITEEHLREMFFGPMDGHAYQEYETERKNGAVDGVEIAPVIAKRMSQVTAEYNSQTQGKVYVIVSHGDPIWLLAKAAADEVITESHYTDGSEVRTPVDYPVKGELKAITIPWIDLHRPYIDEVMFECECGGVMKRVAEVFDCWFESGSMPYAQYGVHSKEAAKGLVDKGLIPADFIAEGLDQTRGWFYTLHVLSVALFNRPAYKNVVVNGLILASDGKKLSKRLRNYTPPEELFAKWGVDPVRYFLLSSTAMGEDYRFSDEAVQQTFRQVSQLLWNVVEFYKLYSIAPASSDDSTTQESFDSAEHCLDKWILARLASTTAEITYWMEQFDLTRGTRPIASLINDLSTWYIRRSRDRMKSGDQQTIRVLPHVLKQLSIIMAPFMPFIADRVYKEVGGSKASVHLEDWPKITNLSAELKRSGETDAMTAVLGQMALVRDLAEAVHALRSTAGLKLRQPLAAVLVSGSQLEQGYRQVLAEEVNVEEVGVQEKVNDKGEGQWVESELPQKIKVCLRTDITPQLRAAGLVRELVRQINNLRKESQLTVQDKVSLKVKTDDELKKVITEAQEKIMSATQVTNFEWSDQVNGSELEVGEYKIQIELIR